MESHLRQSVLSRVVRDLSSRKVLAAGLVSLGGILLFAAQQRWWGYLLIAAASIFAWLHDREFGKDLTILASGLFAVSLVPISTDISWSHITLLGIALFAALLLPYLLSRYLHGKAVIAYPLGGGWPWPRAAWAYLILVLAAGYLVLPLYLIHSGVYENWPAVREPDQIFRLFLGTNALGIWDELFFICTVFGLYRRHFPDWLANILQAILFTSFLYELGFRSFGPLIIFPFALVQGFTFKLTKSLGYVVTVHLLFDLILFLILLHSHQRDWLAIFMY